MLTFFYKNIVLADKRQKSWHKTACTLVCKCMLTYLHSMREKVNPFANICKPEYLQEQCP